MQMRAQFWTNQRGRVLAGQKSGGRQRWTGNRGTALPFTLFRSFSFRTSIRRWRQERHFRTNTSARASVTDYAEQARDEPAPAQSVYVTFLEAFAVTSPWYESERYVTTGGKGETGGSKVSDDRVRGMSTTSGILYQGGNSRI